MNKYIRTTGIFFAVWFIASFLNGLLSGASIVLLENNSLNAGVGTLCLAVIFSFLFSAPMVGMVWFATMMAQFGDKKGNDLFQFALGSTFICAIAGALIFIHTLGTEFMKARYAVGLCIIVSAMASALLFRQNIKTND